MTAPSPDLTRAWSRFDAAFLPDHPSDEAKRAEIAKLRARWKALHYKTFEAGADQTAALYEEMAAIERRLVSARLDDVEGLEACAAAMRRERA